MKIKTIRNIDLHDKTVLLRVDYNVPLNKGEIEDDTRMTATIPTLKYLLENNAKIVLLSHLGRPEEDGKEGLKMDPIAKRLSELIRLPVKKLDECIGPDVKKAVNEMKPRDIIMLENTRFYPQEEACDESFCKELAGLADVFVVESFGTAHRKHATTYGLAKFIPAYAGFLMEKEVQTLSDLMQKAEHPLTIIMGGAKIETKIGLIQNFLPKAEFFLIGGGLANTFLSAQGFDIGKSLYEKDKISVARDLLLEAEPLEAEFILPEDVVVADTTEDNIKIDIPPEDVIGNMQILDIGQKTMATFKDIIRKSKTIIWNGPMGYFEKEPFGRGTEVIAKELAAAKHAKTILGGGDTIDALNRYNIDMASFTHVSTGGGAMLQFLEGSGLPGVDIVTEK